MTTQQNTVFLAYSQDAVRRLPLLISLELRRRGYDVFMDERHFRRFDSPPERILNEIERRSHYVLLLTPASVRYGFNPSENRLTAEIHQAKQTHRHMVVLWGYSRMPLRLDWLMRSILADDFESLEMEYVNFASLAASLDGLLSFKKDETGRDLHLGNPAGPTASEAELQAEVLIDEGLTEKYDAEMHNRRGEAEIYFNEALQIDPAYARAYFERAEYLYSRLYSSTQDTDVGQILADYNTSIQLEPDEARYYGGRAQLYNRIHNYEATLADYTSAIRYACEEATYYSSRAQVYRSIGKFLNALADYDRAIQFSPRNDRYFFARSDIYSRMKDFQSAVNDMNNAIELDPYPPY
ncbi:MAG: hypothetical protein HY866_06845, partial [Chloroflexi bacterium]|nr:hypothetical protein [Chloroflexota bacterium]